MPRIAEGRKAPDFTLEDGLGRRVSLANFKGQDVVVYSYSKDDTPGCTKEACGFRDLWNLRRAGVVVLGVSADSPASPRASRTSTGRLHPPLGPGSQGHDRVRGLQREGALREEDHRRHPVTVWVGPDGTVRKHWRRWPTPPSIPPRSSRPSAAGPPERAPRNLGGVC